MRQVRQIRNRGIKRRKEVLDLEITSLLDVLVIILVFLLKSYNSSGVLINIPKTISLPNSDSVSINSYGVNIQVSPTTIWVDDKEILDSRERYKGIYDHGGRRIIPLYDELVQKRKEVEEIAKATKFGKDFSGVVNFIVDKSLKYSYLKKLMYTTAEAGYFKYKFVVLNNNSLN